METYILWYSEKLWKIFDPMTLELLAEFSIKEDALAYINCEDRVVC